MSLENFHSQLKGPKYFKGHCNRKMDELLRHLQRFWGDTLYRRTQKYLTNAYTWKEPPIVSRHDKGKAIEQSRIRQVTFWMFGVRNDHGEEYFVKVEPSGCIIVHCDTCRHCDICSHAAACTCQDFEQSQHICKHIHACCINYPENFPLRRNRQISNKDEVLKMAKWRTPPGTPTTTIETLRLRVNSIVDSSPTLSPQMEEKFLKGVVRSFGSMTPTSGSSRQPANKNITPQRRRPIKRRRIQLEVDDIDEIVRNIQP